MFDNGVVGTCLQKATDLVVDMLHHWTVINSYLPYISGFFVWDMVALGLAVMYHNVRREPTPNNEIGSTDEILDTIRISRIAKLWISSKSSYHCPILDDRVPINSTQDIEYAKTTNPEEEEGSSSYVITHQKALVVIHRSAAFPTWSRSTAWRWRWSRPSRYRCG